METKRWRMGERGLKVKAAGGERVSVENLVIRRSATHTSSVCGVCKLTGWLSFCHGSEGKRGREELRAIILPKERQIYADEGERGGRTSAKNTL